MKPWKWIAGAVAFLVGLLSLFPKSSTWKHRAKSVQDKAELDRQAAIREMARAAEMEANAELARKRAADADVRLRDALRRARERREARDKG